MIDTYLAVDGDIELAYSEAAVWAEREIGMELTVNMTQAIDKLLTRDYLYVGINSDAVDFMPLLRTMRSVTNTPILIVTANFTTEKEVAALGSGADLFARWHKSTEDNIASVMAHVTRLNERKLAPPPPSKIIVYNDLLIAPLQQCVFIGNRKSSLTQKECDVLHLLMKNNGCMLPPENIYKKIWNAKFDDNAKSVIWKTIKNLRKKLRVDDQTPNYIKTLRDVGYSFDPE